MSSYSLSTNNNGMGFPSIFVPEDEKDENYHKTFVQAIANRSINSGYSTRNMLMNECVNFYLGLQGGEEFEFLQKAEDGEVLPAKWMDFNKIAVKIDTLCGEFYQRGYKVNVKAYNKEAQSRKMDERNRLVTEMRFQPIAEMLQEENGLPLQSDSGFIPQTEKELDIYMDKTYKETSEIVMRGILNWLRKRHMWDYERLATYRDLMIMGGCFARSEVVDCLPKLDRRDPRNMIWDVNATDDFLSDSTYWGEVAYMSLGEVTKRYKINAKELETAFKDYQNFTTNTTAFATSANDFGFLGGNSQLKLFENRGGQLRCLVIKGFWQDYKTMSHKYSPNKYGDVHVKKLKDESTGENVKNTVIQVWRQGTLIGGRWMKEFGIMKNQDRSVDNIATTTPPYVALVPNFLNGAIISKVHRMKPIQNLKNIAWYNLQIQMAKSGGKVFMYDISQLPKGMDFHTAMKYARVSGIMLMDSSVEGAGTYNQTKDMDMGVSSAFEHYLRVNAALDAEMDAISGINEARQGVSQGASQAVGVTNSMLAQSNMSTAMYSGLYSMFFTKVLNKQAGLAKIAWAGKERFAPIIGDVGVNFLEKDIELELNDYNVFVEDTPPVLADQQLFYQLVMTAIQSGTLPFLAGMKLLMEKDLDTAIDDLEMEMKRVEQKQQAQQDIQNQQQQQMMQQEQQLAQSQQQQEARANRDKLLMQQMKGQVDMQKIIAQGRFDLKQGLLGFKEQLALKKIDAAIQAQKAKDKPKPKGK
jgi:hypothetical protein